MSQKHVDVECEILRKTDKAVLVNVDDELEVWIPLSQIDDDPEGLNEGDHVNLYVTEWFADKGGLC